MKIYDRAMIILLKAVNSPFKSRMSLNKKVH